MMHSLSIRRARDKDTKENTEGEEQNHGNRELPERLSPQTSNTAQQPHELPNITRKHSLSNSFKNLFVKSPRHGPHAVPPGSASSTQTSPLKSSSPLTINPSPAVHDEHISPLLSPSSGTPVTPITPLDMRRSPSQRPTQLEVVDEEGTRNLDEMIQRPEEAHIPHARTPLQTPPVGAAVVPPPPPSFQASSVPGSRRGSAQDVKKHPLGHYVEEGSLRVFDDGTHEHVLKPIKPEKIPTNTGILSGLLRKSSRGDGAGDAAFSMLPEQNRMDFQRRLSMQSRKTTDSLEDGDSDDEYLTDSEDDYEEDAAIGDTQLVLINKLAEAIDKGEEVPMKDKEPVEGGPAKNYKLTEKYGKPLGIVGKGAYGTVKLVSRIDSATKKEVFYAVKELKRKDGETTSHFSTRLTSEFVISNSLKHVNIVRTLDLMHSAAGVYSEVMEYCAGGDLYTHISKTNREGLPPIEADCFFKQILKGIAYCHSRGVAHCDIKPENVMLTSSGVAKLTDFGTAAVFRTAWEHEVHLSSGACGSEPYVAPEEFTHPDYDPRPVDVWATGVLYLTMATGTYLWPVAKTEDDLYEAYLDRRPQPGQAGCFEPIESLRSGDNYKSRKMVLYGMLDPDVSKRWTVQHALRSPWVQGIKICEAAEGGSY